MKTFRLIRSSTSGALHNMELDTKILNRYLEDGVGVFRVYGWLLPSFTYGVFQSPENELDLPDCVSSGVGVAKRMTGGGILFHHNEITYSFVCSKRDIGEPKETLVSYRRICSFLVRFYEALGLQASFAIESPVFKNNCLRHELCSASYEKYDILIGEKKIGGNAQKRKRDVVFQHGSIPINIDWDTVRRYVKKFPVAMPLGVTTLSDELAVVPDKKTLEQKLIDSFSAEFDVKFKEENERMYETAMA